MASRGINSVTIIGNLGADPETRYTANGGAITSIKVATSESWKDKQTGEQQERTEWHRVKFFGRLAEIAGEYLRKGQQVYIQGSIRTDKFTDKDGVDRYFTDIIANEMQMLGGAGERGARGEGAERGDAGGRGAGARSNGTGNGGGSGGRGAPHSRNRPDHKGPPSSEPPADDEYSDDIPFGGCRSVY